jgi:hypothetical protein
VANAGINDGLVAYYPFDGNIEDASGKRNHGIANGNIEYVTGAVGQGVRLHGILSRGGVNSPDFIKVLRSPSLTFKSRMTVAYFVKIEGDKIGNNEDRSIIDGTYSTVLAKQGDRHGFYFNEDEVSSSFGVNEFSGGGKLRTDSLSSARTGVRHVVYSINGDVTNVYVDGNLMSSTQGKIDFTQANKQHLYIGVQNNSFNAVPHYWYPLDGVIDELRIYNRVLSFSEIAELYNQGNTGSTPTKPNTPTKPDTPDVIDPADKNLKNSNALFDFAEKTYPGLFSPAGEQPTRSAQGFIFRYYAGTQNFVGTKDGDIYVTGLSFQGVQVVGKISDYINVE